MIHFYSSFFFLLSYRVQMLDGCYKRDGGSVTLSNAGTLNARDSKKFSGNCISTQVTGGVSPEYSLLG
ncbi:MAG: hypothetical protein Q4E53_03810 [Eubacteriales bacterium]|nr:hypothetical protein [Eubacteriales bacterium]